MMAPALVACLAAASARAAGLSLFVRSAAAAAEGVAAPVRRRGKAAAGSAAAATAAAAPARNATTPDAAHATEDNDVTALDPLPTELRTWRYQRPNAALLAFGACSALAHALGLATAALALGGGGGGAAAGTALLLPALGLGLSVWTALVAARGLKWAADPVGSVTGDGPQQPFVAPASGALAGIAFACEPVAEALGGAADVVEDRRIVAAEIDRQDRLNRGLRVPAVAPPLPPLELPRPRSLEAAARASLAHLFRDLTTFQGLALTLTWTAAVGCFAWAVGASLLPWPRGLPAVASAVAAAGGGGGPSAAAAASAADPALAYLLSAAGVAALPAVAGHAHALCEHAAYTRRLGVPGTLRASLLARLTLVARSRRVQRGREARGLVAVAGAQQAAAPSVVDVRLDDDTSEAGAGKAHAEPQTHALPSPRSPPSPPPAPLFPPPPHNAAPGRFDALRASFAAASALQLLGLVGIGASGMGGLFAQSPAASPHLSDPRFAGAQAAARAALDAPDPALAALSWACLLGALWLSGQLLRVDFKRLRALVMEGVQLASKVIDLLVRGLFWDAYWVMQNRVVY